MKRIISMLVAIALVLSMAPSVFAATGTVEDPIDLTSDLLYEGDFSATVTVPAGTTHSFVAYRVGGMNMTINDGEPVVCTTEGMMAPYAWTITNDGTEDAEYVIEVAYPVGTQANPEVLEELSWYCGEVEQAEGNTDGYHYTWTAVADGVATFYFGSDEALEGYILDIIVTNQNTYAQMTLSEDGVDNYGMELQVPVSAGDTLVIQIVAIEDAEGNYAPAATMTWWGNFAYPAGTEQNPQYIEWTWNDDYSAASTTVTVEAGKTVYFTGVAGMILLVNGDETEMSEEGVFAITNSGEAEATYELALETPVGAYSNPEIIDGISFIDSNSLAADESYYYSYTATEDTTVVLTVSEGANLTVDQLTYTEDSEWPISEQFVLAEPEIDENWNYTGWIVAEDLTIEMVAGQELKIQVNGLTDWETWSTPAIDYTLSINYLPGTEGNPHDLTNDLLYENDFTATVTVPAGATYYCLAYRVGGMYMTINDGEPVLCTTMGMMAPYTWTITNDGDEAAEYVIVVAYPVGTQSNPEILFRPNYIAVAIEEGNNQGYYYKWTAIADGELKLTCPAVEGVEYDVNMTNMTTYAQAWLQDSTDGTITLAVSAGDEVIIQVAALPDDEWNIPALEVALTGEFIYPIGHQMNPEVLFRPNYIAVAIEEGNTQGYYYKWTAAADGALELTCPAVEGVAYDVNMINMSTCAQVWLQDSTDGTITLAVSAGDEVIIQVAALPDEDWNTPALEVALTGEFIYPIGTQMNPEVLFRPNYIAVAIEEGNNQGYYYKWTAIEDGELKLTCPAVEGVAYDVNMINLSTYAQVWLQDSTNGTITLAVSAGDEVIIQVAALPDEDWNTPALEVALTGEFIYPVGTQMNPEVVTDITNIDVNVAAGNNQGYYYKWTANVDGKLELTCPTIEGVAYGADLTNLTSFATAWLSDSTDGTITLAVMAGDEVIIHIAAEPDADWNYPALEAELTGELIGYNGWTLIGEKWAYYENGVKAVNAWAEDSTGWCYLGADGYMVYNTWAQDSKGWCYLGADGYMVYNTWAQDSKGWCYLGADGYMVTNTWAKDSKGWCYLGADGYMVYNTWAQDSKGWCYLGADGYMVTNTWAQDSKGWCYLGADGYMVYNTWAKDSKGWCYLGADGYMVTNTWAQDSKGWCFVGEDGYMVYDCLVINYSDGKVYVVGTDGYMIANDWIHDGYGWAYCTADGSVAVNQWINDGTGWYFVGTDGYWTGETK